MVTILVLVALTVAVGWAGWRLGDIDRKQGPW